MIYHCRTCGIDHPNAKERDEIHAASRRVHQWMLARLKLALAPVTGSVPQAKRNWGAPAGLPEVRA